MLHLNALFGDSKSEVVKFGHKKVYLQDSQLDASILVSNQSLLQLFQMEFNIWCPHYDIVKVGMDVQIVEPAHSNAIK